MKRDEFFQLKLNESKDILVHINDSIRETRNRLYFLIGLILAIFSYLIDDVLNNDFTSLKSVILYSIFILMIYVIFQSRFALKPLKLRFNGIEPKTFKLVENDKSKEVLEKILNTYQISIDVNGSHLAKISKAFNKSFNSLVIWFFITCLCIVFSRVIQCYI
jgi:hypothetical protein